MKGFLILLASLLTFVIFMVWAAVLGDAKRGYFQTERVDERLVVIEAGMCQAGNTGFWSTPDQCHSRIRSEVTGQEWIVKTSTHLMTGRHVYFYCWMENGEKECRTSISLRPYTFKDNWYYKLGQFLTGAK